ncbi:hypothetical protein SPI_07712 [Niveomyces insectorum RCEF 264]|uniref:Uncharacterized protein n=1 Tax=Niveomyces insectorum RCEF 264 TaxID=1081102 RepID=A0A162IG78_9HYPO|nr:hypothetical protein SPI_07712 [Niveomyces insectorum RCEF 264]
MPSINPVVASAGVIALSMAVAAAIAVYESPEIQRLANDLRRRIALAFQSLGENIAPEERENDTTYREPVFNRPEDAEGFLLSRGGNDPGVVADEASRRRQREELLYWNRMRLLKQQQEGQGKEEEERPSPSDDNEALLRKATQDAAAAAGIYLPSLEGAAGRPPRRSSTSFDAFLRPDHNAARGTYVVNTGADVGQYNHMKELPVPPPSSSDDPSQGGQLRRRRPGGGVRGLNASVYANPFGDEYGIEMDEQHSVGEQTAQKAAQSTPALPVTAAATASAFDAETAYFAPDREDEILLDDIYSATEPDTNAAVAPGAATSRMDAVFDPLLLNRRRETAQDTPAAPNLNLTPAFESSRVPAAEVLFDAATAATTTTTATPTVAQSDASLLLDRALADNDYVTAGQALEDEDRVDAVRDHHADAFSSIQAWAQSSGSNVVGSASGGDNGYSSNAAGFYSPLPVTPSAPLSEPELLSAGQLTPVGSVTSFWSHEPPVAEGERANDDNNNYNNINRDGGTPARTSATAGRSDDGDHDHDDDQDSVDYKPSDHGVLSEFDNDSDSDSDDGVRSRNLLTPTSWSEVGSVVSESDGGQPGRG